MTSYSNGGVPSKASTHRIIVGAEGITIEPIDKPRDVPQYASRLYRK